MSEKFKTIVRRSEWLRGTGQGYLLDAAGKKCCLGFRCIQAGISLVPEENWMPHELSFADRERLPEWLLAWEGGSQSDHAAATNDSLQLTDHARETKLKEIFASQGEEIEFVD